MKRSTNVPFSQVIILGLSLNLWCLCLILTNGPFSVYYSLKSLHSLTTIVDLPSLIVHARIFCICIVDILDREIIVHQHHCNHPYACDFVMDTPSLSNCYLWKFRLICLYIIFVHGCCNKAGQSRAIVGLVVWSQTIFIFIFFPIQHKPRCNLGIWIRCGMYPLSKW